MKDGPDIARVASLIGDPVSRLCMFVTPQAEGRKIAKFWGGGTMGDHARATFAGFEHSQVSAIVAYLWWRLDRDGVVQRLAPRPPVLMMTRSS